MKKDKRRNHHRPTKQTHNPAPVTETIPKDDAPNSDPRSQSQDTSNEDTRKLERGMLRWTRIVGVFTAVLAIVGGIQAWAFIQSERAFLSIVDISIDGNLPQAGAKSIRYFMTIKNSGRSTAFIESAVINAHFGPLPKEVNYVGATQIAVAPIAIDVPSKGHGDFPLPFPLSSTDAEGIKSGTLRASYYGFIKYSDDFALFGSKVIGFCFSYTPLPTGAAPYDTCNERAYTYAH